jgi:hypothetical protein
MDREPVESPDAARSAFRKADVVILRNQKRVLAVLAESAVGVLKNLAAVSASNGIMAHDPLPRQNFSPQRTQRSQIKFKLQNPNIKSSSND